jgi:hypothetical protein
MSFRQVTLSSPTQKRPRCAPSISTADYLLDGRGETTSVTDFSQVVTGWDLSTWRPRPPAVEVVPAERHAGLAKNWAALPRPNR